MSRFELKVPPVLLFFLVAFLMWVTTIFLPGIEVAPGPRFVLLVIFVSAGGIIAGAGVRAFNKSATTVNPMTPEMSSSLVTSGIYQHTRNPMYVGLLFALIGWGFFLSSPYSLLLCIGFILYMNRFQIRREEAVLDTIFGPDYRTYKTRVRRWL